MIKNDEISCIFLYLFLVPNIFLGARERSERSLLELNKSAIFINDINDNVELSHTFSAHLLSRIVRSRPFFRVFFGEILKIF